MPGQRRQHRQQPLLDADGSSGVSSTTSARCRPNRLTAPASARPVGLGDHRLEVGHRVLQVRGHVARTRRAQPGPHPAVAGDEVDPVAGPGRRARRAAARRPSRSRGAGRPRPGRPRSARCRAPARTRRSRSGCQVRTTTSRLRALARQSIERTSSPRTYSRSESNSVPWPRTRTAARPSSSRSRASRLGQVLAGLERRQRPHRARDVERRCRAARPSGPTRAHGDAERRAGRPRRVGSGVRSRTRSPGAGRIRCRLPSAPAVGCQASRSTPRTRRRPVLVTEEDRLGVVPAGPSDRGSPRTMFQHPRPGASSSRAATSSPPRAATATPCAPGPQHHRHQAQQEQHGTRPGCHRATSAGDRHRAERGAEHLRHVDALELGLGTQPEPVREGRLGQRLDVVGGDEVAAGQPGPGPGRAAARWRRAGLTPRLSDGDSRVARAMSTM